MKRRRLSPPAGLAARASPHSDGAPPGAAGLSRGVRPRPRGAVMSGGEREPGGAMPEWAAGPASQYRGLLALEFGDRAQFANPRHEWRRLFAELLGTFLLVLAA